MAYYTELQFDEEMFMNDFMEASQVAHEYAVLTVMSDIHGSDVWRDAYVKKINEQYADIVTNSIVAFMEIFGTGVKMAKEDVNPYLAKYKRSKAWNRERPSDGTVMYRPDDYRTLDWESDRRVYIDREGSGHTGVFTKFPAQEPQLEKLTMVLKLYGTHFHEYLNKQLESINMTKYFFSTKVEV